MKATVFLLCALALISSQALALTNTWDFSNPSQYVLSNSNEIEVADGVAKLKLSAVVTHHSLVDDYLAPDVARTNVAVGPDISVGLTRSGSGYALSGEYISRVLDGGANGNIWQKLYVKASNRNLAGAGGFGETMASEANVLALYHLNNSWQDEILGQAATPVGSPVFVTDAKLGSHAVRFNGSNYAQLSGNTLLQGQTEATIACWVKIDAYTLYGGLLAARGAVLDGFCQSTANGGIGFFYGVAGGTRIVYSAHTLSLNTWYFLVGTVKSGQKARLYFNGALEAEAASSYIGAITQDDFFKLAVDDYATSQRESKCVVDEVVIMNRALSEAEVLALYSRVSCIGVQVRSGLTSDMSSAFIGPDATSNSYFTAESQPVPSGANFNSQHRYAQYRAVFASDGVNTPALEAFGLYGSKVTSVDNVWGDFMAGQFTANTTNMPAPRADAPYQPARDTPYVSLAKAANGGYLTNGTFTSRALDGGAGASWGTIAWTAGTEISTNDTLGVEGLWHLDSGNWVDSSGKGRSGAGINVAYTSLAKQGMLSAVFDGVNAHAPLSTISAGIYSIEFWIRPESRDDSILELIDNTMYLAISNSHVFARGFTVAPTVYVNGAEGAPLLIGSWNHVAVIGAQPVNNASINIGEANNDYFEGQMDEIAVYSRPLTSAEVTAHFVYGRRSIAGRTRIQVRAGNTLPLSGSFVGWDNTSGSYFEDPQGTALPAGVQGRRYLQYQALLEGNGSAAPGVNNVRITYGSGSIFVEDTSEAFYAGTADNKSTRWVGDEVSLLDLRAIGPDNINAAVTPGVGALWHLDESVWGTVIDSSGYGRHGGAEGDAQPVSDAKVGLRCGKFDGAGDDLLLGSVPLSDDFSAGLWVNSTSTVRSAAVSTYSGGAAYYAIEFNSDGTGGTAPGKAAFVISDGATPYAAVGEATGLNDGRWHHLMGVRNSRQIHFYVDGVRSRTTAIPNAYGAQGSGQTYVGRHGSQNLYFSGLIDEVVVFTRAVSEAEISGYAAAGYSTLTTGEYIGPVLDATQKTIWERLAWGAESPYGQPQSASGASLNGLWHLDAVLGAVVADATGHGLNGQMMGGNIVGGGKFSNCVSFAESAGQYIVIPSSAGVEPSALTIEAWVNPEDAIGRVVFSKEDAGVGYVLGLDGSGRAYFAINGTPCVDQRILRVRSWSHVAGSYDGIWLRLYVNGELRARVSLPAASFSNAGDALIGKGASGDFFGLIDEVALYSRALNSEDVLDHYRAGAVTLKFQARSGDSIPISGPFVGPSGSNDTYFTDASAAAMQGIIPLNRYFQYRAVLATEDGNWTPLLEGIWIYQSSYPQDMPWVAPAAGYGGSFLGNLLNFQHVMATNSEDAVRYQVTGDTNAWYFWNVNDWSVAPSADWGFASPRADITANIGTLYDRLYAKLGGTFKFKAFLRSSGFDQVAIDRVDLTYAGGRLVVIVPNGGEVGDNAWVAGVTNVIRWTSAGLVSPNVTVEFSDNSGSSWVVIGTNAPNAAGTNTMTWLSPSTPRSNCRIKVTDPANPTTIWDMSDADFQLVRRYRLIVPNGGEKWYAGGTNRIVWQSPPSIGDYAWLYANLDGATDQWLRIGGDVPNAGGTNNFYDWVTPTTNASILSEQARVRVAIQGGQELYSDTSDTNYTLAGIRITTPGSSTTWKRGSLQTVRWKSAGAGLGGVDIRVSSDGGGSWSNVAFGVTNVTGSNSYSWVVAADNPTPVAVLSITSRSDPKVRGFSDIFTIADVDIKAPRNGDVWRVGETNKILWTTGGAGNRMNIYYSASNGAPWVVIASQYPSTNFPATNSLSWVIPSFPGEQVRVKVEEYLDVGVSDLYAISDPFSIGGVRIESPNGGELWPMDQTHQIRWAEAAAGGGALLQFSYDNGSNFTTIAGPGYAMVAHSFDYVPTFPSVRARARIQATDAGLTNMADVSDGYFTVSGVKVTRPSSNDVYTMGIPVSGGMVWYSAGTLDDNVGIQYAPEDGSATNFLSTPNKETYPGDNTRDWTPSFDMDPSANARIQVIADSGGGLVYTGRSDRFVLRGIRLTSPARGGVLRIGNTESIQWLSAGFESGAGSTFYLSTDGGASYQTNSLFSFPVLLDLKQIPWPVPADVVPSTNAIIKMVVTNSVTSFQTFSPSFNLRGLKILAPDTGANWPIGSSNTIQFIASMAGDLVNVYYAADGVNYDMARPVALNYPMGNGLIRVPWTIEDFRQPSTNARVWVQSATQPDSAISQPFTVGGVKVIRPTSVDIWAVDETNRIQWISVGMQGTNTIELIHPTAGTLLIVSNATGATFYDWTVPSEAIGSNLVIRVRDSSGYAGYSEPFRVVSEPTIRIVSPADGDFLKMSETYTVSWAKAGNMSDNFVVQYSFNDFQTFINILGAPFPTNGTYQMSWTLDNPDRLGSAKLRVYNSDNTNITDTTEAIYLVPKFEVRSPNGGESFYALRPTIVEWFTWGNTPSVDLYYSTDLTLRTNSWVKINSATNKGHLNLSQYLWTVANVKSDTVRVRVQDAAYKQMFVAGQPGPYDDCDASFAIRYYVINWHVFNAQTSNTLDRLSVTDSSGWSESGLQSSPTVVHEYPYGTSFDTVWSREYFYDKVVFDWSSEPSRTIEVPMSQSEIAPDYKVMANFVFDTSSNAFRATSWLERSGRVIPDPTKSTITLFDSNGGFVVALVSLTPDASGVFWQLLPSDLDRGKVYFAKVDIERSGAVYSSGVTFNLRVPTEQDMSSIVQAVSNLLVGVSNVNANVLGVSSDLTDLSDKQAAFRIATSGKLDAISNMTASIQGGVTNIYTNLTAFATQSLARLDSLTSSVGVIYESTSTTNTPTTLPSRFDSMASDLDRASARILTRPTEVKSGTTVSLLYRTRPGLAPTLKLTDPSGFDRMSAAPMAKIGLTGIYETNITFLAAWGLGDFKVNCADTVGSDTIVIKVNATDLDQIAGNIDSMATNVQAVLLALSGLSNQMNTIETDLTNTLGVVTNVQTQADTIRMSVSGMVDAVDAIMGNVSNVLVRTSGMDWNDITNILLAVSNVQSSVSNAGGSVVSDGLSNIFVRITNMDAKIDAANWGALSGLPAMSSNVTAILGGVSNLEAVVRWQDISNIWFAVTNMNTTLGRVDFSPLTNVNALVSAFSNMNWSALSNISLLSDNVTNILRSVTNLQQTIRWGDVQSLTSAMERVSGVVTTIQAQTAGIRWGDVTNIMMTVSNIDQAVGSIDLRPLTNLTAMSSVLSNINWSALSNINVISTDVTNMMGQLTSLQQTIRWGDVQSLTSAMERVSGVVTTIQAQTAGIRWGDVTNIMMTVSNIDQAVGSIDLRPLTNLTAMSSVLSNINWSALSNINVISTDVTNMMGQLTSLQQTIRWGDVQSLTSAMERVSGVVTTIQAQTAGIRWGDVTNIMMAVSNIDQAVGSIDLRPLTNLTSISSVLSNIDWSALSNINVISTDVTNMMGQLASLQQTIRWGDVQSLTSAMERVSGVVTTIQAQTAGIRWGDVTNIMMTVSNIDQAVGNIDLRPLTNLTSISSVLSNINWSALSNINIISMGVTNIVGQVARLQQTVNWGDISNIFTAVTNMNTTATNINANVTNMMTTVSNIDQAVGSIDLRPLTNLTAMSSVLSNINWSALSNINVISTDVTNMMGQLTSLQQTIRWGDVQSLTSAMERVSGVVTTIQAQTAGIRWGDVTNIMMAVSNIDQAVGSIDLRPLTNLTAISSVLSNINWSALSNINVISTDVTNMMGQLTALQQTIRWGDVTNIMMTVSNLNQAVGSLDLRPLTNLTSISSVLSNIDWSALSNINVISTDVTNIMGQVARLQQTVNWGDISNIFTTVTNINAAVGMMDLAPLTNLNTIGSVLTNIDWSALTNITAVASDVTRILNSVTNLQKAMQAGDLAGISAGITNLETQMAGLATVNWSVMSNTYAGVTNASAGIAALRSAVRWGDITNLMDSTSNLWAYLAYRVGNAEDAPGTETLFGRLAEMSNSLARAGTSAGEAVKKAQSANTSAQGASAGISTLKTELGGGRLDNALRILQDIKTSLYSAQQNAGETPAAISTKDVVEAMQNATDKIKMIGSFSGFSNLVTQAQIKGEGSAKPESIVELNQRLAEMKASVELIGRLMDETVNKPVVVDWLAPTE